MYQIWSETPVNIFYANTDENRNKIYARVQDMLKLTRNLAAFKILWCDCWIEIYIIKTENYVFLF